MLNNDNGVSKRNYNDNVNNDNVVEKLIGYNTQDAIADKLCKELGNQQYRAFYCKVAYSLPEVDIWSSLEIAKTGKYPAKYFTWLVKRLMAAN